VVNHFLARASFENASDYATKARLDAEAAFSRRSPALVSQPLVVIKRNRLNRVEEPLRPEPGPEPSTELREVVQERAARVFRIDAATAADMPGTGAAATAFVAEGTPFVPAPVRRRRRLHSKVVITRPGDLAIEAGALEPDGQGAPASDTVEVDMRAPRFIAGGQLGRLLAQIAALERRAAILKEREALKSVRWIKAAIAKYKLTASELGF